MKSQQKGLGTGTPTQGVSNETVGWPEHWHGVDRERAPTITFNSRGNGKATRNATARTRQHMGQCFINGFGAQCSFLSLLFREAHLNKLGSDRGICMAHTDAQHHSKQRPPRQTPRTHRTRMERGFQQQGFKHCAFKEEDEVVCVWQQWGCRRHGRGGSPSTYHK